MKTPPYLLVNQKRPADPAGHELFSFTVRMEANRGNGPA
jgi:hypothetical protein